MEVSGSFQRCVAYQIGIALKPITDVAETRVVHIDRFSVQRRFPVADLRAFAALGHV